MHAKEASVAARKRSAKSKPAKPAPPHSASAAAASRVLGLRELEPLAGCGGAGRLAAFAVYRPGTLAPWWLHQGVCDAWGLDVFRTELRLVTVAENATFSVLVDERPYAMLRVCQPGYVGDSLAVASEVSWVQALVGVAGVHVVEPLPMASGFYVADVRDESGFTWSCVCTRFVPGLTLEHAADPSRYYRTVGEYAARLHEQARRWCPPQGFTRFSWDIDAMAGENPRWGSWRDAQITGSDAFLFERAAWTAREVVARTGRTSANWGLIHADMQLSNIVLGPDGELTIIDFDDCGYSWYLYDFAAALTFVEHKPYAPALAQRWAEGYNSVSPLSDADIDLACALSMLRRLQMIGWTRNHYRDALPEGLLDEQIPGTRVCAYRYLENPRWLFE